MGNAYGDQSRILGTYSIISTHPSLRADPNPNPAQINPNPRPGEGRHVPRNFNNLSSREV